MKLNHRLASVLLGALLGLGLAVPSFGQRTNATLDSGLPRISVPDTHIGKDFHADVVAPPTAMMPRGGSFGGGGGGPQLRRRRRPQLRRRRLWRRWRISSGRFVQWWRRRYQPVVRWRRCVVCSKPGHRRKLLWRRTGTMGSNNATRERISQLRAVTLGPTMAAEPFITRPAGIGADTAMAGSTRLGTTTRRSIPRSTSTSPIWGPTTTTMPAASR